MTKELHLLEHRKEQSNSLDYLITEQEIRAVVKN